jgi:hypothetical protein
MSNEEDRGGLTAVVTQHQVTKGLRNILTNELGVTGEAVSKELAAVVGKMLSARIDSMLEQSTVKGYIIEHLNKVLLGKAQAPYGSPSQLDKIVRETVQEEVRRIFRERVSIDVRATAGEGAGT